MDYRIATINDIESIATLHAQSWVASYRGIFSDNYLDHEVWADRKTVWTERLTDPKANQYVLVATEDEAVCAFICAFGDYYPKRGLFIDNLHVSASHQGTGIGKKLMRMAAEWSLQSYPDLGMHLEVLEANSAARGFYQALGATHEETNLWQPPGDGEKVKDCLFVWANINKFLDSLSI